MILTYSRSTYLSFLLAFTFIAFKKKNLKIFIVSFVLIVCAIFLLPRQEGEGTKLERTSSISAKIEKYKEGLNVFIKSPIIGYGYNNLYFVRTIKNPNSHANFGFDSSLLTILTTSGIIGLILFILGLKNYFIKADLTHQSILIALLLHSLFANSLLYPWIIVLLVLI
jgi:O-antigen ligase